MSFQIAKIYNLDCNVAMLAGFRIQGFGEDSGIEYEPASAILADKVGADGEVSISKLNDKRLYVTFTVMENSVGARILGSLRDAQAAQKIPVALPYAHFDPINGDEVVSGQAFFMDYSANNKGREAGERQFRLLLAYSADKTSVASNILF